MSGFEGAAGPGRPAREQKRRRFLDFPTWPAAEDGLTKAGCWCQLCFGKTGSRRRKDFRTKAWKSSQSLRGGLVPEPSQSQNSQSWNAYTRRDFVSLWKSSVENQRIFLFFVVFSVTLKKGLLRDDPAASKTNTFSQCDKFRFKQPWSHRLKIMWQEVSDVSLFGVWNKLFCENDPDSFPSFGLLDLCSRCFLGFHRNSLDVLLNLWGFHFFSPD